ncbi:hypothetical protein QJS04_geneDACA009930 [Acorus gramineus]|uniref:DUF6821 domain-containing protein n=1 Tax=Acorus gramineus TaxID=55184 RepID=A0AAV9BIC8_ACOGR|nr:hypothetical protein QJS04_geneDACA009930 [Acorus gramineus]
MEEDWEVLQNPSSPPPNPNPTAPDDYPFDPIDAASDGAIRSDYFALDAVAARLARSQTPPHEEDEEIESDNPSWVDPNPDFIEGRRGSNERVAGFWSDSSADDSIGSKSDVFDGKEGVGLEEEVKSEVGSEGIAGEVVVSEAEERLESGVIFGEEGVGLEGEVKSEVGSEVIAGDGAIYEAAEGSESGVLSGKGDVGPEEEVKMEVGSGGIAEEGAVFEAGVSAVRAVSKAGEGKKGVVWWKLPFEMLRFCAFQVKPVWSFSIAAAVIGLAVLGRRLYRMKSKSRSIAVKVTVDDKKVSQFMVRAARLNEAFSVVRRVPIVRAQLPAGGVTPWPVMSMR